MANTEIIFEVTESPEGGYEARALGYSIFTHAETLDELREMIKDAVRCHFEDASRPRLIRLHNVKTTSSSREVTPRQLGSHLAALGIRGDMTSEAA